MTIQPTLISTVAKQVTVPRNVWMDPSSWSLLLMFVSPADLCCLLNLPAPSGIINDLWNLPPVAQNPSHGRQCSWAFHVTVKIFNPKASWEQMWEEPLPLRLYSPSPFIAPEHRAAARIWQWPKLNFHLTTVWA